VGAAIGGSVSLISMPTGTRKPAYAPRFPSAERREQLLDAALGALEPPG
jgi:hypothetical protein